MTLIDLFRLIGRYWKICIALPLLFAVGAAAFVMLGAQNSYSATAYVVTANASQLSAINGTASSAARDYAAENPDYTATAKADQSSLTVSISVSGPDASGVVSAANKVADSAVTGARKLLGKDNVSASVQTAAESAQVSGRGLATSVIIAFLAGLLAAVFIVVCINAAKRPIKSPSDLKAASNLPVLGVLPGSADEYLLANVRFSCGEKSPRTLLIVPSSEVDAARLVGAMIGHMVCAESSSDREAHGGLIHVSVCAPLSQGVSAAYEARAADAVLLVAAQWKDSQKDVESTVAELNLAGANSVGCVLVNLQGSRKGHHNRTVGDADKAN